LQVRVVWALAVRLGPAAPAPRTVGSPVPRIGYAGWRQVPVRRGPEGLGAAAVDDDGDGHGLPVVHAFGLVGGDVLLDPGQPQQLPAERLVQLAGCRSPGVSCTHDGSGRGSTGGCGAGAAG